MLRVLKGQKKVLPLDFYRELTGLRDMDEWAELMTLDLLESAGWEDDGDGFFSPILPTQLTKSQRRRRH